MVLANQSFLTDFVLLGFSTSNQLQPLLLIVFLMVYLLSLACNILIMGIVHCDQKLCTPMYFFISAFSFLEICYTSVTMPRLLRDLGSQDKVIPLPFCLTQFYFLFAFGSTENFILSTMAYDRYVAICKPLRYMNIMSQNACVFLVLGSWIGGFLAPLFPVIFLSTSLFCGSNEIDHFYCDFPPLLYHFCDVEEASRIETVFFFLACTVILANFAFICISYAIIIATIANIPSPRGRKKTLSTCGSHFIVVFMFYGSIIFMYVRSNVRIPTKIDKVVSLLYCIMTPSLNPLIYGLRNQEMKQALKRAGNMLF
ncbi:olfactory receptor 6C4-like [Spea bombifrons]|uniref:olfactory receptor 6C4-like n=1 Tax=Spea bombifrons TaxID=233779 RepID=UPI00234A6913|nr:olfactory receptor 6C4-like [Spea bombifrons]